jgi:hypothetical protein
LSLQPILATRERDALQEETSHKERQRAQSILTEKQGALVWDISTIPNQALRSDDGSSAPPEHAAARRGWARPIRPRVSLGILAARRAVLEAMDRLY